MVPPAAADADGEAGACDAGAWEAGAWEAGVWEAGAWDATDGDAPLELHAATSAAIRKGATNRVLERMGDNLASDGTVGRVRAVMVRDTSPRRSPVSEAPRRRTRADHRIGA